ncbi:MAG: c-type cytochrome, partial [Planctomycetota bacterium]
GVYKWKSTERGSKPTRKDLKAILVNGAPGSAMPSFSAIEEEDIETLVDYVIYLSIRGEFERRLLYQAVDELGYEGESPEVELSLANAASFGVHTDDDSGSEAYWVARDNLNRILEQWVGAEDAIVQVPAPPAKTAASIDQGRQLFHGKIANCSGCHGTDGLGGVPIIDFDDWTKEFTTRLAITPTDKDAVRPFRNLGALRPRQIKPRRISGGWFHGGGDGETLYRRFTQGIAGTPMPGQILTEEASSTSLSPSQVWSIVHYVQSLAGDGS